MEKLNFKFDASNYSTKKTSANYDFSMVYEYAVKNNLKDFAAKPFRNKVRDLEISEKDIFILIDSGFVAKNKDLQKYKALQPVIDSFVKKYSNAK